MIETFIQGNVYPYQQRIAELEAENELLRQQIVATKPQPVADIDFLEVEPSDAERATWPDQTQAYVESLEQALRAALSPAGENVAP